MKRCPACDRHAYYVDVTCQRCGATIIPPPPAWAVRAKNGLFALCALMLPFQIYGLLDESERGRAVLASLANAGRYVVANWGDIAGFLFAFVVAPLVGLYFFLRAMVDVGDWMDLKVQQWRAERLRKHGW